jgi:N-acetylneuraminic acid mutarotase
MKKKSPSRAGFLNSRTLMVLLLCAATACFILIPIRSGLAFLQSQAPSNAAQRTLTFEERVSYQRAIEEVYWRHRIWPKERPDSKPSLDAVMSQAQLEKKVTDYLRNSEALEDYWQRPITAEQLQAEMDRMAQHTKQPEVLQELFEALGNDPRVIAECLARPALAHPLFERVKETGRTFGQTVATAANYILPTISDPTGGCVEDTWTASSVIDAPTARVYHTAVWTGIEMIIWGGIDENDLALNTGGRYYPSTDNWATSSTTNAPIARLSHTAVWTGSEMIVWGGIDDNFNLLDTGGRYNPNADTWVATSTTNAPTARSGHTAVWSGTEMIVWAGGDLFNYFNTGGRYNPATNSWTATSTINAPVAREVHTAVWAGDEMIVWGGEDENFNVLNTGGRYNPITNSWLATNTINAPSARESHTAVWANNEMIIWGSYVGENTGGRYNPGTNSWLPTSTTSAPAGRGLHTAVWTGDEMIIWGGSDGLADLNTGGKYNLGTDSWTATGTTDAPTARQYHTAVWTGSEMVVWGGYDESFNTLSTGGRYCAQSGPTPTPTPTVSPTPTASPSPSGTPTPSATPRVTPRPRPTPHRRPNAAVMTEKELQPSFSLLPSVQKLC